MVKAYLSPAFSRRSDDDLDFLMRVNNSTAFSLFWPDVVRPLLERAEAKRLMQIGAYKGEHTRLLLQYCCGFGGSLVIIEPFVLPELEMVLKDSEGCHVLYAAKSHEVLLSIQEPFDVVLLNGDINYYTVYEDLSRIGDIARKTNGIFPTVIIRSMSWPYARRDMYYDPESLSEDQKHASKQIGMTPWSDALQANAFNAPYYNACLEGGPRNGVLTAVEDFIESSPDPLRLFTLPINNGLGIIYRPGSDVADFIRDSLEPPPALRLLLETWEIARLNDILLNLQPSNNMQVQPAAPIGIHRIYHVMRRIFRI